MIDCCFEAWKEGVMRAAAVEGDWECRHGAATRLLQSFQTF